MNYFPKFTVFIVDDDVLYLKMLEIDFKDHGNFNIHTFSTAEDCIKQIHQVPDLIVLDYHLDGINKKATTGIQALDQIKKINPNIPIVILSAQDKIEVAIECMHHKAYDYVVKSETAFMRLKHIIEGICKIKNIESQLFWYMERM
jgi:DNA-binding NtrC family response regulator